MNAEQINNEYLAWLKEQIRDIEWQIKSTERILESLEIRLGSYKAAKVIVENRRFDDA